MTMAAGIDNNNGPDDVNGIIWAVGYVFINLLIPFLYITNKYFYHHQQSRVITTRLWVSTHNSHLVQLPTSCK
jgi:hypothetical protein